MTVSELITLLSQFPKNAPIQMRDCTGDWSTHIHAQELGMYVYIMGTIETGRKKAKQKQGLEPRD